MLISRIGGDRLHVRCLQRFHTWIGQVLADEWVRGEARPLQMLVRYRDREWFRTVTEAHELRGRNTAANICVD